MDSGRFAGHGVSLLEVHVPVVKDASSPVLRAKRRRAVAVLSRGERVQQTPFGTYMAVWNKKGQPRERKCFPTLQEAKEWLESRRREGVAPPLTSAQYASAQTALAILPPGVTLADAARAFVAASGRGDSPGDATLLFSGAVSRYFEDKKTALSPLTVEMYERTYRSFAEATGDPLLTSVTPTMISKHVEDLKARSRNRVVLALSSLFSWCVRHGLVYNNPCALVARARNPDPPRGILTVEQASALMHGVAAQEPALVPYIAIALFAGVRPSELSRLRASAIGQEYIRLDASITKATRARTVTIHPNLRAWLDAFPAADPIIAPGLNLRLRLIRRKLGIPWPHDCMRHSYATYAYEKTRNAELIAAEMGHRGTDVFFRHYRALANPGDGQRFFAIVP